jgi:hypothetical protein
MEEERLRVAPKTVEAAHHGSETPQTELIDYESGLT